MYKINSVKIYRGNAVVFAESTEGDAPVSCNVCFSADDMGAYLPDMDFYDANGDPVLTVDEALALERTVLDEFVEDLLDLLRDAGIDCDKDNFYVQKIVGAASFMLDVPKKFE